MLLKAKIRVLWRFKESASSFQYATLSGEILLSVCCSVAYSSTLQAKPKLSSLQQKENPIGHPKSAKTQLSSQRPTKTFINRAKPNKTQLSSTKASPWFHSIARPAEKVSRIEWALIWMKLWRTKKTEGLQTLL